jgi:transcriptional regulator GlxA family with amidase domain
MGMEWTEAVREAVSFMESRITEEITMHDVAAHVNISPFYFHKIQHPVRVFHNGVHQEPQAGACRGGADGQ